jgi:CubicO group peptidase (beta-lactamase class C family)
VRERGKDGDVDGDTVFAIASNTKAFIGTLVAVLEQEQKLSLDDRVKDRLPWFKTWDPYVTQEMRIRDLVTHRSGLDRWAGDLVWIGSPIDTRTLLSRLPRLPAKWGLREHFGYCNLMFVVAGEVLREVTGKPWDALVAERFLEPIGMKRTTTSVAALAKQGNVATPHSRQGDADVVDVYLPVDNAGAAAAINSSAADMARWMLVHLENGSIDGEQIVPPEAIAATRVPHTLIPLRPDDKLGRHFQAYGLGWFMYDYKGRTVLTHGGGLPGMTSRVLMVPEERLGVVVLTNSETPASAIIAMLVADGYLGGEAIDHLGPAVAATKAAREEDKASVGDVVPAKAVKGTFKNPLLGRAVVGDPDGLLELRLPDHGGLDCPLTPRSGETYRCEWSNPIFGASDVTFELKRGRAVGLKFKVRPDFVDPLEYTFTK